MSDAPKCPQCQSPWLWLCHYYDIAVDATTHKARLLCRSCGWKQEGAVSDKEQEPQP